ncbi:hypothetical protein GDO81_022122, partial [Engystomops pustulosus]
MSGVNRTRSDVFGDQVPPGAAKGPGGATGGASSVPAGFSAIKLGRDNGKVTTVVAHPGRGRTPPQEVFLHRHQSHR